MQDTMYVARRNRSWTPELKAKLYGEVMQITADGTSRKDAFDQLRNQYGVTAGQLSNVFYKMSGAATAPRKRKSGATMSFLTPSGKRRKAVTPDIAEAIALLKKMGANVTISF